MNFYKTNIKEPRKVYEDTGKFSFYEKTDEKNRKTNILDLVRVGVSNTTFVDQNGVLYLKTQTGKLEPHALITELFEKLPNNTLQVIGNTPKNGKIYNENLRMYEEVPVSPNGLMIVNTAGKSNKGRLFVVTGGSYKPMGSSSEYNTRTNHELESEAYHLLKEERSRKNFPLSFIVNKERLNGGDKRGLEGKLKE